MQTAKEFITAASDSQTPVLSHSLTRHVPGMNCQPLFLSRQALAAATGRQESLIKKQYDESGDLGTVASAARATQRTMFTPSPLTIPGVLKLALLLLVPESQQHLVCA